MITTLALMNFPHSQMVQALTLISVGVLGGMALGKRVAVTELPQTVAAFHALVGLAAMATSIASLMIHPTPDAFHIIASFLGTFIGGVTLTGSVAAFIKLANLFKGKTLTLPHQELLNRPLALASIAALVAMLGTKSLPLCVAALFMTCFTSSVLGWNIIYSIGSADMPVAITVLNSYSGWALCAEGFMLSNPLLTIVGALIGSSGAILSYIMCRAMNRSLYNVIFGTMGQSKGKAMEITGTHTEITQD